MVFEKINGLEIQLILADYNNILLRSTSWLLIYDGLFEIIGNSLQRNLETGHLICFLTTYTRR